MGFAWIASTYRKEGYGVQMAVKKHYRKRKLPKPLVMERIARAWEPYRSIACWYMWRSLDIKTV